MTSLVDDPTHHQVLERHRGMLDSYIDETEDYFPNFGAM